MEYLIDEHFMPTIIDDDLTKSTRMQFYLDPPDVLLLHIQATKWDHDKGELFKPEYHIIYNKEMTLELDIVPEDGVEK